MDDATWQDAELRTLGLFLCKSVDGDRADQLFLVFNAGGDCEVTLPDVNGIQQWKRVLDTGATEEGFAEHPAECPAMVYGASVAAFEPA